MRHKLEKLGQNLKKIDIGIMTWNNNIILEIVSDISRIVLFYKKIVMDIPSYIFKRFNNSMISILIFKLNETNKTIKIKICTGVFPTIVQAYNEQKY